MALPAHDSLRNLTRAAERARLGVSPHYAGERGLAYSRYQLGAAEVKARVAAAKFAPYLSSTDVVVDFGCGPGRVLAGLDVAERIGVEANPHTRRLAEELGVRVVERTADLAPETADVAISHHALEHTLSPLDELRQLRGILKTSGRLVLVVPVDDWRVERRPNPEDINHHLYTWTPLLLGNLLGEAGFAVDSCRVVRQTLPGRFTDRLGSSLPPRAFAGVMALAAVVLKRPEIRAVARSLPA